MGKEYTRPVDVVSNTPNFGNLIVFEDFNSGNHLTTWGAGDDWEGEVQSVDVYSGNASFRGRTKATDPSSADDINLRQEAFCKPEQLLTYDVVFKLITVADCTSIHFELYSLSPEVYKYCSLSLAFSAKQFSAIGMDSMGHLFGRDDIEIDDNTWNLIHFVWDIKSNKLKSLHLNNFVVDPTGVELYSNPMGVPMITYATFLCFNKAPGRVIVLVDNFRISTMEI